MEEFDVFNIGTPRHLKPLTVGTCSWPNTHLGIQEKKMRLSAAARAPSVPPTAATSTEQEAIQAAGDLRLQIEAAWHFCRIAVDTGDKDAIRRLHLDAKHVDASVNYAHLQQHLARHSSYFPSGAKINPELIDPVVVPVTPRSLEERLFKTMRGYWSMPYSKGYGRRLRFVVMDAYHQAVIGIIGLQSPSADLACRDNYLGIAKAEKLSVINNTLDAYTIGASPSYAPLLGGKLVAGLLHSDVIRKEYWRTYGRKHTTQLNQRVPQPLIAITTASAFGRSSIYNRLKYKDHLLAKPLGYTKGFGTLHLEAIYPQIVEWLKINDKFVPGGFGNGPKVRWQNIVRTLIDLGLSRDRLEHGLRREVFIFELAHNVHAVCQHGAIPEVINFDDHAWSNYWKERWCLPRVVRSPNWHSFDPLEKIRTELNFANTISRPS